MDDSSKNSYLDQVVVEQQRLEENLKAKRQMPMRSSRAGAMQLQAAAAPSTGGGAAVEVRITGFWRWKTVIVPPNAYVVHTRRGRPDPLHIGLGVSFRFDPYTDAFLAVPGAMQTILINARCISSERQGVLVQSYVQWIIQDISTAYKKLDFSDVEDPMRLVNLMLREQAEAAIKDKVSTMSIDEILADKQPIIEELTARLRSVAEGGGSSDKGLGLRIVTVQIKEAVVSSQNLWENLQKSFRAEQARIARLAEIESQEAIRRRELEAERSTQEGQLELTRDLAVRRAKNEAETFDREQSERRRRAQTEQENARSLAQGEHDTRLRLVALEQESLGREHELATRRQADAAAQAKQLLDAKLAADVAQAQAGLDCAKLAALGAEAHQQVENAITPAGLDARVVAALPELLSKLPKPDELKSISISGGEGGFTSAVAQVATLFQAVRDLSGRPASPLTTPR